MKKLRCQYSVKDVQRRRLPAIVDGAVWKKSTKGQAGIKWDTEIEKLCRENRGTQDVIQSRGEGTGFKAKSRRGGTPEDIQRVEGEDRDENIPVRPYRRGDTFETAISGGRPRPARKKKRMHRWSRGGGSRCVELPLWGSNREQNS